MNIEESINELYDFTINNLDNAYKCIDIGVIDSELGKLILDSTGVDVSGFCLSIGNYSIRHTLQRHGNPIKEASKGQIGVEKHHFKMIIAVILNPDKVRYEVRRGKESLIFEKEMKDFFIVCKELRRVVKQGKVNRLMLQTFYIKRNSTDKEK